jgi:hypothetical protein
VFQQAQDLLACCKKSAILFSKHLLTSVTLLCAEQLQGTALIVDGAGLAAVDCKFQSELSGLFVKESDAGTSLMTVSLTGCSFSDCTWGANLGFDLPAETEKLLLAVNTFENNSDSDITTRHTHTQRYKHQNVQPWRRSWALAVAPDAAADTTAAGATADAVHS